MIQPCYLRIYIEYLFALLGDEEAALGNSHPRTASSPKTVDIQVPPAVDGSGPVPSSDRPDTAHEEAPERKEKSVLQAKLTKLAIQIGYAGKFSIYCCFRTSNPKSVLTCKGPST